MGLFLDKVNIAATRLCVYLYTQIYASFSLAWLPLILR